MSTPISELHKAARDLASQGVPVFPCVPGTKTPATEHGFHEASADLQQIDAWWTENPKYNVAFCPHMVGLAVIDLDGDEGEEAWEDWQIENGYLPLTFTVRTPRGGRHLYYRGILPPTQSKLGKHVDTRGVGSYALVPPSVVGGHPYVLEDAREYAGLPDSVGEYLERLRRDRARAAVAELDLPENVSRARKLLRDYVKRGRVAIEGSMGNGTTFVTACEVMNLGVSPETALEIIDEIWNPACLPPWDKDELGVIIENASRYAQNDAGAWAVESAADTFGSAVDKLIAEDPSLATAQPIEDDEEPEDPFKPWTLAEMRARPRPSWLLPDLFPSNGLSVLYGPPGTFKSFLAVHWSCTLAALGQPVIYVAGEDSVGIQTRVDAWLEANGMAGEEIPLRIVENAPWVAQREQCEAFCKRLAKLRPALIVMDTLARAAIGLNENDTKDMMTFITAIDGIKKAMRCAMLVIHHSGKDESKGARGSGALTAGVDASFEVTRPHPGKPLVAVYARRQKACELRAEPWTFEAAKHGGQAIMRPMSVAKFHDQTSTEPKLQPVQVGAALNEMGAVGEDRGVTTQVLAAQLANMLAEQPGDEEKLKPGIARALGKRSGDKLQAYCKGSAPDLLWFAVP